MLFAPACHCVIIPLRGIHAARVPFPRSCKDEAVRILGLAMLGHAAVSDLAVVNADIHPCLDLRGCPYLYGPVDAPRKEPMRNAQKRLLYTHSTRIILYPFLQLNTLIASKIRTMSKQSFEEHKESVTAFQNSNGTSDQGIHRILLLFLAIVIMTITVPVSCSCSSASTSSPGLR